MESLIKFDKQSVSYQLIYDMKCRENFQFGFNYLANKISLKKIGNLSKMKWIEGKNYDWIGLRDKDVIILIRKYHTHFTIYFKREKQNSSEYYGCFIFSTNNEMLSDEESDKRVDDNCIDLNKHIKRLVDVIRERKIHSIWNNYSYKREKYIELKNVWNGGEDICNIDDFIFALEELGNKFTSVFSKTDMLERIKSIKVDDVVGGYKVKNVITEPKDEYYHGVGIDVEGHYFMDVYFLTNWNFEELFSEKEREELFYKFS